MSIRADGELVALHTCALCHANRSIAFLKLSDETQSLASVICARCGLVRLAATLSDSASSDFYSRDVWRKAIYQEDLTEDLLIKIFEEQIERAQQAVTFIEEHTERLDGKTCLDVGCATGGYVSEFRNHGVYATGIEPSTQQSRFGLERMGLAIRTQSLDDLSVEEATYDVVLCVRMLNHLTDPLAALVKIHTILDDDGILYLEVLNFPHALMRKSVEKCIKLDHPYMFSVRSLTLLVQHAGFQILAQENDLTSSHDFRSRNHIHIIARKASSEPLELEPHESMYAWLECLTSLAQFQIDQHLAK